MRALNKAILSFIFCWQIMPVYASPLQPLVDHMRFLSERDAVLAKNIANVDTPNFRPSDLKTGNDIPPDPDIQLMRTSAMHMVAGGGSSEVTLYKSEVLEQKPNGNAVTLEHELMKKNENAVKLQQVSNVYNKARNMMKTAIMGVK